MAVLSDVRIAIRDNGTDQRFTDAEVTSLITDALNDVNVWAGTTWSYADLNDIATSGVPLTIYQLTMLTTRIKAVQSDLNDLDRYAKFVTQDVQYDPGNTQQQLTRVLWNLMNELEMKLKKWIGLDDGAVMQHTGELIGGESDFA